MTAASKKDKTDKSIQEKTSSPRIRTIKTPAKPGKIKRSVIRKAVKEIMAEQQANL